MCRGSLLIAVAAAALVQNDLLPSWDGAPRVADGAGPRFAGLVHHADGAREWAYDRRSSARRLDKALDSAKRRDWQVVDMKADWKVVYPFERL